jgi:hypothetical protein
MYLLPAPDDPFNAMYLRLVSENGIVEMGVYPVLFGFRVRAGFCGDPGVCLDWCAGHDWSNVERLYAICRAILLKRPEERPFSGLPGHSQVKPFFLDHGFTVRIIREAGDVEPMRLARPML